MANRERAKSSGETESTPQRMPSANPPLSPTANDYNLATLQTVMEMQKQLGELTEAVDNLSAKVTKHDEKIDKISHIIYAAGILLAISVTIGGFLVNKVADVLIHHFENPATQQIVPSTPSTQNIPSK